VTDHQIDLSAVAPSDVTAVLNQAADLLAEHGWSPTRTKDRLTVLRAITKACDAIAGPGVDSAELHMAALDAVCQSVFGQQCGTGVSVSRWERQVADTAIAEAIRAQVDGVVQTVRDAAATHQPAA
jgi:hypothetical protein